MAASGGENGGDSQIRAKFLDLQKQMAATKEKLIKLIEHASKEGATDDQRKAAVNVKKEFQDLSKSFQEFVDHSSSTGVQNLNPAVFETYGGWIQDVAQQIDNARALSAVTGHHAEFLDFQERMETTKRKVQEMADNLKRAAEEMQKQFEGFSQRFQEFVNQSCPFGVQNLDPSMFQTFNLGIQELAHELNAINVRCQNPQLLRNVQTIGMAEEQDRLTDLRLTSSVAGQATCENIEAEALLQAGLQAMETDSRKIQEQVEELNSEIGFDFLNLKQSKAPAGRYGLPPLPPKNPTQKLSPGAAARNMAKKKLEAFNRQLTGTDRSLTDIVMEFYGFEHKEAEQIEIEASFTLAGWNAYQDRTTKTGRLAGAKILNWNGVNGTKQLLQTAKAKENKIPGLIFKIWVFCLETQMYILVRHLRTMMPGNGAAIDRLRQLRTSLIRLRDDNDGMVPIVVHRILASMGSERAVEQSDLNRDQHEALYRRLDFDKMIDSIENIILWLRLVLITSGDPIAPVNQLVLTVSEQLLEKAQEEMSRIEGRIIEERKNA
ncbi:hypothetical protein SLA2020_396910 [Shorea laevis]